MSIKKILLAITTFIFSVCSTSAQAPTEDVRLTGTVIGTLNSVDYATNKASTTVNTREMAFDGDVNTYFASYDRSLTWVGLDLGEPHVITRIGWCPANRSRGEERIVLGVFEGANSPDFMDALPLYIITEKGTLRQMDYAEVACSKGFRYVRYVGPADQRCNIAEVEFYGHVGEGDESHLYRLTNLPVVSIHTENNVEPYDKVHAINALITVISDKDKKLRTDSGTVRLRGNGSNNFPKKPYRIKFNKKHHVLDSPAKAKKWALINNYGDKTLMRNLLANEVSRGLGMPYTPYAQSVDVLVNGEYKGSYQLMDHVDVKENRVELDTLANEEDDPQSTAFLIEVDAYASSSDCWFRSNTGNPITIHYPDDDEITPGQKEYIMNCVNTMESKWRQYLDVNTFYRFFLVGEFAGNTDTFWSTYMYKHRQNDTIFTGPVWDMDLAFENDDRTYPINSKTDYIYRSGGSLAGNMRAFVDKVVVRYVGERDLREIWGEARMRTINEEHLLHYIDSLEEYLQASQKLNFMRWPIMNQRVHQNPVIWGSYAAEVQNVRRYVSERLLWMDNKLGYTYDPSGISDTSFHFDFSQSYSIYNLSGMYCGSDLHHLPQGIYILRQGRNVRKITVQ